MKSAYELAMSRLEKESPTVKLTDAKRAELAEIDQIYDAKIAERRVFLEGEIRKASATNPHEVEALQRQLALEVRRLEEDREAKKDKVRS